MKRRYDFVVIGSGFGSLFFVASLLRRSKSAPRIIVLERGGYLSRNEQVDRAVNATTVPGDVIETPAGHKQWNFTVGVGGGTLCWWGQTPRMHPADFEMRARYGIGRDWPLSYAALEPYYCEAEDIIGIAGDSSRVGPFWRSRPYPMPAHLPSSADARMREAYADQLPLPSARTSVADGSRPQCCAVGRCELCPTDAKFTALNGLDRVLDHPAVTVVPGAEVKALSTRGGTVEAAVAAIGGRRQGVSGDFFVLGANAIFNPAILARSGIGHAVLGKGINEQVGYHLEAHLSSLSGVDGGTSATGMFCRYLDGEHRRDVGATAIYFDNRWKFFGLRKELNKLLRKILLVLNAEDMPQPDNFVETPKDWDDKPIVHHARHSEYGERGIRHVVGRLPGILAPLGVEKLTEPELRGTESHLQGTTPMGSDPAQSIVDGSLLHHGYRNLAVVGTSVFPTCPVANPSLTAAALSLRAAAILLD